MRQHAHINASILALLFLLKEVDAISGDLFREIYLQHLQRQMSIKEWASALTMRYDKTV